MDTFNSFKVPVQVSAAFAGYMDVAGLVNLSAFSEHNLDYHEMRVARYRKHWRAYKGVHHEVPIDSDNEVKPVHNWCRLVVDKSVDWFCAKGFKMVSQSSRTKAANVVNNVWESAGGKVLTAQLAKYLSIAGDAFVYVPQPTETGRKLIVLNPGTVFPYYNLLTREIESAKIAFYIMENGRIRRFVRYVDSSVIIDEIDGKQGQPVQNAYGVVPLVHFTNTIEPEEPYGDSDIVAVVPLQDQYNSARQRLKRIVRYHAEPQTIIKGANAANLQRGADRLWFFPVDPKSLEIETLELKGDPKMLEMELNSIIKNILAISEIPESLIDPTTESFSHNSGVAIFLRLMPIVQKTQRKRTAFEHGLRRLLTIVQRTAVELKNLSAEEVDPYLSAEWTTLVPEDEVSRITAAKMLHDAGAISSAELIRRFTRPTDFPAAVQEIVADQLAKIYMAREMAVANSGGVPLPAPAFLGSLGLTESGSPELVQLRKAVASLFTLAKSGAEDNDSSVP